MVQIFFTGLSMLTTELTHVFLTYVSLFFSHQTCNLSTSVSAWPSICSPCPAGFNCSKTGPPTLCGRGKYSIAGNGSCQDCPNGYVCPTPSELPKVRIRSSSHSYLSLMLLLIKMILTALHFNFSNFSKSKLT